jgi:TolB-like protein/DNA-binding winged helix-turn-helix (wHTH) protein
MVSSPTSVRVGYRFGPFTLDLRSGDLTRNGRPIRLQEKPRSLLLALAERRGELVSRKELHEHLWPNDTFVDFEDGLNAAMSKLREALEDSSQFRKYIETERGRGYRFIARVEVVYEPGVAVPTLVPPEKEPRSEIIPPRQADPGRRRSRPAWLLVGALLAGLAVTAVAVIFLTWRASRPRTVSIAVLPFANQTGDASRDYLSTGITEELIARLSRLAPGKLRVIAPVSSESYSNTGKRPAEIGRELDVQYLVKGSLEQQGAQVRVAAELVRIRDQSRLWANVYVGDLSDAFAFEDSVAESVGHALSLHLPAFKDAGYRPGGVEAHDAYLKGLYFLSQRNNVGFQRALESFSEAVAIDPKYAAAYAELADAYNLMGQYNWINPGIARSLGWAAAEQALSLDPSLGEAHAALGFSDWFYRWEAAQAEQEFKQAVAVEPYNVNAHHWYEQLLMTSGRFPEAERQMRSALEVDPRSRILRTNLGWLYEYEGRFPQAIQQVKSVAEENPGFLNAHYKLWYIYSAMGDRQDGRKEFEWLLRSSADPTQRSRIEDLIRDRGYAAALEQFAQGNDVEYYGSIVDGARCLAAVGDQAGALGLLERAYQAHEGWMIYVPADPAFTMLHTEPRFQRLVAEIRKGS